MILQACFVEGRSANGTSAEIRNWLKKVAEIRPREVHLGTQASRNGRASKPLATSQLEELASQLIEEAGIQAQVIVAEALPV